MPAVQRVITRAGWRRGVEVDDKLKLRRLQANPPGLSYLLSFGGERDGDHGTTYRAEEGSAVHAACAQSHRFAAIVLRKWRRVNPRLVLPVARSTALLTSPRITVPHLGLTTRVH